MHDAENQDPSVLVDHVVHHAMVADAKSVERVARATDGFDRIAADATLPACATRQLLQGLPEPVAGLDWQFLERLRRRRREPDAVGGQTRSLRFTVRPFA